VRVIEYWRILLACACIAIVCRSSVHAESDEMVEVRVTASSGGGVYLDKGRAAGIRPGDEVLLYPPGRGIVKATVESVSSNHSRCTLVLPVLDIDNGIRGVVRIRADPNPASENDVMNDDKSSPERSVPDHPPWNQPLEDWNEETPLLAPVDALEPSEREPFVRGRLFAHYFHTWNRKYANNQYSLARVGTVMWLENPFHRGGGIHLDAELSRRDVQLTHSVGELAYTANPSRLSYYWGGTEDRPLRYEVGRFLQSEFPEFGVLDGAEIVYRTESGNRFGFSLGAMPEPFPDYESGEDLQAAIFYRFVSNESEDFSAGIGYQKTLHKGKVDRDLFVGTVDYVPSSNISVHGTVWGDYYGPEDELKSNSFEITQAILQGTYQFNPGHGFGVHLSQIRWPELLRNEIQPIFATQITGNRVLRYGVFTWQELSDIVRIDGRVDRWQDQDREGTTWDVSLALRDWLYDQGEVAFGVYGTDGIYNSGPGGRVSLNRYFSRGFVSLSYDVANFDFDDHHFSTLQHSVHAAVDLTFSSDVNCSLSTDYWFGETQESFGLGFFVQKRF
jgi:hypothetical protein